jgi:hypothetical protein
MALVQRGPLIKVPPSGVVMLERSEASGCGVDFNIYTFLHLGQPL